MKTYEATIFIVEDDVDIRSLVSELLQSEGFDAITAKDAIELQAALAKVSPDLIILDVMLPGEDGFSLCRKLRARNNVPILMLTAKRDEIDRVVGLEMGADDYVLKPFSPRELVARVRALLRRAGMPADLASSATRRYSFDRLIIDLDARQLLDLEDSPLVLTSAEFDLLACFITRPRRVLTREQLLDWTRGRAAEPYDRTVDVLISRLRKKLAAVSSGAALITTVRNGGYLFTATVKQLT